MLSRGKRLVARIGPRGEALFFFAALDAVYCYGLLTVPRPLTPFYQWMQELLPLWGWAACWGGVGLLCLIYAFRARDTPAFVGAMCIKVGWGLLAFFGWMSGVVERGYVSAVVWLAFAALVLRIAGGIPALPPKGRTWTRS